MNHRKVDESNDFGGQKVNKKDEFSNNGDVVDFCDHFSQRPANVTLVLSLAF